MANGKANNIVYKVIVAVSICVIVSLSTWVYGINGRMIKTETEMVNIKETVKEIKTDVKELLKRSGK